MGIVGRAMKQILGHKNLSEKRKWWNECRLFGKNHVLSYYEQKMFLVQFPFWGGYSKLAWPVFWRVPFLGTQTWPHEISKGYRKNWYKKIQNTWVFPKIRGTPKWMVYNGNPYWNGWFGGKTHYFWKHPYLNSRKTWESNCLALLNRGPTLSHDPKIAGGL